MLKLIISTWHGYVMHATHRKNLENSINVLLVHHLFKATKLSGQGNLPGKIALLVLPNRFFVYFLIKPLGYPEELVFWGLKKLRFKPALVRPLG